MSESRPVYAAHRQRTVVAFLVVLAVVTALLSVLGQASSARADGGTATLSGTVTAAGTGAPISDVSVQISSVTGAYSDFATTADDGTYSFAGIPADNYTLVFQPDQNSNYLMQWWDNKTVQQQPTPISIADGQTLTGYDAQLQPGASISGTVDGVDAPGTGLANVNVIVQSTDGLYGGQATTDASGNYTVIGLAGDAYDVDFQPSDGVHVEQWWNDKPTFGTSNYVAVADAGSVSGINAHLAVGGTISGTVDVAGSPGTPLAGASVTAFGPGDLTAQGATTDASGNYTITGLPTASYSVSFEGPAGTNYGTQYWQNASAPATATLIPVTEGAAVTGIDAAMTAGATIKGTVYAPGTPKVALKHVQVSVFSADGGGALETVTTNKVGKYSLKNLAPGSYSIEFEPQSEANAAMEWWGGSFIQTGAATVTVASGQTLTHINQQLIVGSTISGTVVDAGSPTTPDGNVEVLLWASDQIVGEQVQPPRQVQTDASGNYSIANVGPGTYTLDFAAGESTFVGHWWKDKPSQAKATPLVVKRNQPLTGINATLAPAVITPGTPTISGHARVGATLTVKTGSWKPKSILFSFQWLRNGVAIPGEIKSTYVPTTADLGDRISVAVTGEIPANESQGDTDTVTSAATAAVTN